MTSLSQDAKKRGCNCTDATFNAEAFQVAAVELAIVRQPLDCACMDPQQGFECNVNLSTRQQQLCTGVRGVTRSEGCGLIELSTGPNLSVQVYTFDATSCAMVGISAFGDSAWGTCADGDGAGWSTTGYVFGGTLNEMLGGKPCPSIGMCNPCDVAAADLGYPPCP